MEQSYTRLPSINLPSSSLSSVENIAFTHELYSLSNLLQYKKYIQDHLNYNNHRINRALVCDKQLDRLITRLSNPPETIYDLINHMNNYDNKTYSNQIYILNHLVSRNENNMHFLTNYEKNTSTLTRYANIEGTFTILGTVKNFKRAKYEVKLYKHGIKDKGSFWCNCPDHKFNSKKKNIVCRHICFIVCKVAKILDPTFFETKYLTEEQFNKVIYKAENLHELLNDLTIYKPPDNITLELFTKKSKVMNNDDVCPICYDTFTNDIANLSCPTCANYIHQDCMHIWLDKKPTCVYCRSDIWTKYKDIYMYTV